ncbi:hypothetical protein [Nonomuraea salmonea]|uniref:hypothetical protein n=1 Tax=Nonomuraea salmonea TaxID=46181 RepID=UPI0031E995F5
MTQQNGPVPTEVRQGRAFPYVVGGQWVVLSGVSSKAVHLYFLLRSFVRSQQPREISPTLEVLAEVLGLKKSEQVKRYRDELEKIGAVDIRQVRHGRNNMLKKIIYTVHEAPPEDYTGVMSVWQYLRARDIDPDTFTQTGQSAAASPVPPSKGVPVPPSKGVRYPLRRGYRTTRGFTPLEGVKPQVARYPLRRGVRYPLPRGL